MKRIRLIILSMGIFFTFLGCDATEVSLEKEKNVGYFVTIFNKSIDYDCDSERQELDQSGKFECTSFPISFYMDNVKLGEISNIHRDGYVYPQDIIVLEEKKPTYTSNISKVFLSVE